MDTLVERVRSSFTLADVRVEPDRNILCGADGEVRVEPKVMDVLVALAEAGGEVVTREALINRVWSLDFGGDESVSRAISLLRKALKEAGLVDGAIETVPKRGYRLAVPPGEAAEKALPPQPTAVPDDKLATDDGSVPSKPPRRAFQRLLAAGLFILAIAAGLAAYFHFGRGATGPGQQPVVAVLPFDDLSPSGDYGWFAEGLADELINNLARVPDIVVIGRRSSFQFRDSRLDARAIGDRLGARYLIEGGVRRDGGHLRISATLVDSKNQATLWSATYEREDKDVFAVQAELARAIVRALGGFYSRSSNGLTSPDLEKMIGTKNPAAFDAFLMGNGYLRAEGAENVLRATEQFRRATELDPGYLDAWKGLHAALSVYDFWHPEKLKEAQAEAKGALEHALKLAPDDAGIRLMYGWISAANGDMVAASHAFRKVLKNQRLGACNDRTFIEILLYGRIDPDYAKCLIAEREMFPSDLAIAENNQNMAHLIGRDDITVEEFDRSVSLPGGPGTGEIYAVLRDLKAGDRDKARAHFRSWIDFLPAKISEFEAVYDNFGDDARVRQILNDARIDPANQDPTRLIMIANMLAAFDDPKGAADALRRHFLDAGGTWWHELWMPEFAEARKLPVFKEIIRKKGFERLFRKQHKWNSFCQPVSDTDFECR